MAFENPTNPIFGCIVNNDDGESYSWLGLRFTEDFGMEVVTKPPGAMRTFFNYQACLNEMSHHGIVIAHLPKQPPKVLQLKLWMPPELHLSNRPENQPKSFFKTLLRLVSLIPMPGAEHTADIEAISQTLKELRGSA